MSRPCNDKLIFLPPAGGKQFLQHSGRRQRVGGIAALQSIVDKIRPYSVSCRDDAYD